MKTRKYSVIQLIPALESFCVHPLSIRCIFLRSFLCEMHIRKLQIHVITHFARNPCGEWLFKPVKCFYLLNSSHCLLLQCFISAVTFQNEICLFRSLLPVVWKFEKITKYIIFLQKRISSFFQLKNFLTENFFVI